ncbi:uncharacterized protein EDB91DRAFT_1008508, partial [Suillus paluster]|uniref:uncharacterized protein n=1 Tax=Suillus paluster TaxID=48578 RepID=UPI001B873A52
PLPDNGDQDLTDPVTITEALGHAAVPKTAGAHRKVQTLKGKGKMKWTCEVAEDDDDAKANKRGCPSGSNNYTSADVKALLNFVKDELPLDQQGWLVVHTRFAEWSKTHGHPDRKVNSIETKFKQLVKTTKPTGDGVCPPDVMRAHHIDSLINERAGTRDLNDKEFDNNDDGSQMDSSGPDEPQHIAVVKATRTDAPIPRRNAWGAAVSELLTRLLGAFDPSAQRAHDEERASRTLANTQLMTQAQQLRDLQQTTENLCNQLFDVRDKLYYTERACDKAEMHVEMLQMSTGGGHHQKLPSPVLPRKKSMVSEWFPDGGQSLQWVSD